MDGSGLLAFAPYVASAGGWLLAFYFAWCVYTGRLVAYKIYNERKQAVEKWQQAYDEQRDINQKILLPMADLLSRILNALPHVRRENDDRGQA